MGQAQRTTGQRRRLGIDMDGVICDFNAGWIRLHEAEFGSTLQPEMVIAWDNLHELAGFADMAAFWRWARPQPDRPSIFRHLEPYPDAIETLQALRSDGHDIVIITAKPRWAIPDTLRWLADHELPTGEIHIQHRKSLVACDVYLDDSPLVLPELLEARPTAMICRMVRPWNVPLPGAVDVGSWQEFRRAVNG